MDDCRNPNCGMTSSDCDEQLDRTGRECCAACRDSAGGSHIPDDEPKEEKTMAPKTTNELVDGDVIITKDGSRIVRYVRDSDTWDLEHKTLVRVVECYYVPGLAFGYSGLPTDTWEIAAHVNPGDIVDPQPEVPGLVEIHRDGNARMFDPAGEDADHQADVEEDKFWGRFA